MFSRIAGNSDVMLSLEVLFYPGICLFLCIFLYIIRSPQYLDRALVVEHHLSINMDKCASEDCVRCNRYKSVLNSATTQYEKYKDRQIGDRLHSALRALPNEPIYREVDPQRPNILYVNGLAATACWGPDEFFSDVTLLESEYENVLAEFQAAYEKHWPDGWLINNTPTGEWAVYHLRNQGIVNKANCDKCPKTVKLLDTLVSTMTGNVFANASFSVVQPGTHITPHYGPTNIRLRCHMGLRIPNSKSSYININGNRKHWREKECLIFDDSFLHEVHHEDEGDQPRAILLVDLWHPELNATEREVINDLFHLNRSVGTPIRIPAIPIEVQL